MGNANRTILVNIWDDPDAPNGIQFNLSGYDVQNNEVSCDKKGMKKEEFNKVTFEINNRSVRNWLFPSDVGNAMWVGSDATNCPETKPAENPEFPLKKMNVSSDREQLSIENKNSAVAKYKFALNFVDGDDQKHLYPFDPIWNNQNGGSSSR
jgi:hypothetical protein